MNTLLVYFALPIATIILAIVLEKIIENPFLVAATAFAIYLIVTYAAFDDSFLIFAIIYTILAFLAAFLTRLICCLLRNSDNPCLNSCEDDDDDDNDDGNTNCGCGCNNRSFRRTVWRQ